uniref:Uncharacterized protein n=1 Tax=Panagrolaimus davidi TaxID=227884 RepID=A0A914QJT0_9BILA
MTKTPPAQTPASSAKTTSTATTGFDPALLTGALQQLAANGNANTGRPIIHVPSFVYDAAEPNNATLWFSRLSSLFRFHQFTPEEKVAMAVNALDDTTQCTPAPYFSAPAPIKTWLPLRSPRSQNQLPLLRALLLKVFL